MISYAKCHGYILIIRITNTVLGLSEFLLILRKLSKYWRAPRVSDQFWSIPDTFETILLFSQHSGVARGQGGNVPLALGLGAPKWENEKRIKHFF